MIGAGDRVRPVGFAAHVWGEVTGTVHEVSAVEDWPVTVVWDGDEWPHCFGFHELTPVGGGA